ncbi:hypothetical protein FRP1_30330 (plasmid) [Pseudonocardia sp. EC080625-04]|uniref:hypothetical protein n=1 Tax=Pseudonocardia sp. EC080625-04 TaxID=1096868 RepID=UPI0006CB390B|nr:hypothetical protein [Pseudonocardia sp. EC080625-04]ALE77009.1 hypothetical protein FRP1_30330 [Pseudonocardia sp. EC080625-04]
MTRPTFVHPRERLLHFADSAEGHSSGVADNIRNLLTDLDRMTDLASTAATTQVPRPRPATAPTESTGDPLRDAIAVLFTARHQLPPDALRSLADIWSCGPAARCGEPHERFWDLDPTLYTEHRRTGHPVGNSYGPAARDRQ